MTDSERDYALRVARAWAFKCGKDHDYLPKTSAEMSSFEPHEWVLEAIAEAANDRYERDDAAVDEIDSLLSRLRIENYDRGDLVIAQCHLADYMDALQEGRVRV